MSKVKKITSFLESIAPSAYQESYDNVGLIVGDPENEVTGVLISLDSTEEVVEEAINKGCNLIVAHHPIIFGGLKSITGKNYVEKTIIKAIKHDIAIFACHTNIDNILGGVSSKMAEVIGLEDVKILAPKKNKLTKLSFFAPNKYINKLLEELHEVGVGKVGNYEDCSFCSIGVGSFTPNDQATPHIGKAKKHEKVEEIKAEVILPSHLEDIAISTLEKHHPYEEVSYFLSRLENKDQEVGSGAIGMLSEKMEIESFFRLIKEKFHLECIRHTPFHKKKIQKIALCGGAGSFLLNNAIRQKADVYISSDFKYHEFFDAENKITLADIGHFESEAYTKQLFYELLNEKFINIALYLSEVETNPIKFYI